METQVLGLSVDSVPCLTAWAKSLGDITYPLLSDFYPHGEIAKCFGVLRKEGFSERAIFVIDKKGVIRYVDVHDIDQQPDNEELFRVLAELEPAAAARYTAAPVPVTPEPDADVVLYCTPWCPNCMKVRGYLKSRKVEYVEIDISKDRSAAARVRRWANGFETTPTIKIRGQVIVGFERDRLEELLG